jgi:CRISPR system Cascade subunit CasD
MQTLAIYLDAPLQSWGASSKYQYRETNGFPTKSGITGLLAAALGIDKHGADEEQRLAPLAGLRLTVARLAKPLACPGRLADFHTIGGGYDKTASLREKMSIPPTAEGKWKAAEKQTVITRRGYLTDTTFAVLLEGDPELLGKVRRALLDPVWGMWYGRKACIPASPLSPVLAETSQDALDALLEKLPGQGPAPLDTLEYQAEIPPGSEPPPGTFWQSDLPVAYGQHHGAVPRAYQSRGVLHHRPGQPVAQPS